MQDFICFGGYLARLTWACTTLYHSSTLLLPCLKLVSRSKWTLTSFDYGLQNPLNFPQIVSKVNSSAGKHHETYWSMPKFLQSRQSLSCIVVSQAKLQAHTPEYFPISRTTLQTIVKAVIYCPVQFGTFNIWHEHAWNWLGCSELKKGDFWVRFLLWAW